MPPTLAPAATTKAPAALTTLLASLTTAPSAKINAQMPDYTTATQKLSDIVSGQQNLNSSLQQAAAQRLQEQQAIAPVGSPSIAPTGQPVAMAGGSAQVKQWIDTALNIMNMSPKFEPGIANIIMHESSGNPNSINRWDSNAQAGHPSQGLMQTIPGTFQEYALPGYNKNILDPISNIIAGVRYALSRYGKGMILAGGRHTASGQYEGY